HRVDRLERLHGVLAAVDLSARRELLGSDREARREIPEGEQFGHKPLDAPRPVDLERHLASVHGHALDHAGQSEEMVSVEMGEEDAEHVHERDRKSTRLNSSHVSISYAVFCLKKKINNKTYTDQLQTYK